VACAASRLNDLGRSKIGAHANPESGGVRGFILKTVNPSVVTPDSALEVRLEIYSDGEFPVPLAGSISRLLEERWPGSWDVKIPTRPTVAHPAEWRAVVPIPPDASPESLHHQLAAGVLALDPSHSLHLRTRWASQESPDHQEVYEERWAPGKS
jgi:hypothetical protein